MTDRGREFEGAFHERVTKYYDIEHLYSIIYCRFAERAIRTIKEMILQRQQATGLKWTELLEPVVRSYNSTAREGTGMLPEEAHLDENLVKAHKSLLRHAKFKSKQPPLVVGDYVKIIQKRGNYYDRKFDISDYGNVMRPVQGIKESVDGLKLYTVRWPGLSALRAAEGEGCGETAEGAAAAESAIRAWASTRRAEGEGEAATGPRPCNTN
jgi:hypothetical protein